MTIGKSLIWPVTLVSVLVAGCGDHGDKAGAPSSGASGNYDIAKVMSVKSSLPAGFQSIDIPRAVVSPDQLDAPGVGALSVGPPSTVTPPECAVLLKPFGAVGAGADATGFVADQADKSIVVMAATAAKTAGPITQAGCDHITVTSPDGVTGAIDSVPAPAIKDVPTAGLLARVTAVGKTTEQTTFYAALGDRTVVVVQGDLTAEVAADLLSKAVAALQG
ncbi:MAG: DUF5642 family protein [Mycobacterium sp.]